VQTNTIIYYLPKAGEYCFLILPFSSLLGDINTLSTKNKNRTIPKTIAMTWIMIVMFVIIVRIQAANGVKWTSQ